MLLALLVEVAGQVDNVHLNSQFTAFNYIYENSPKFSAAEMKQFGVLWALEAIDNLTGISIANFALIFHTFQMHKIARFTFFRVQISLHI